MSRIPPVTRLFEGKPIIERVVNHPWENKVTFNPACVVVSDKNELERITTSLPIEAAAKEVLSNEPALVFVLYRAQGAKTAEYDYTRSSIGLAVCSPELKLLVRLEHPVLLPDAGYDNLGCEDPRIGKVGERYVMLYTAYASSDERSTIRIAIASTTNFIHWTKHGLLKGEFNTIDNKNAMLFEHKHKNRFVMFHRPMEGTDALSIHWAESNDLLGEWMSRGCLMQPIANSEFVSTWIGGGAPPLHIAEGKYLVLYHIGNRAANGSREYDLGIALLDLDHPEIVVKRDEPLLRPSTPAETIGDEQLGVNNVVFICGAYFYNGDLYFPYAGSDSVVLAGKISGADLKKYI